MTIDIEVVHEHALSERDLAMLRQLLDDCLPDTFIGRTYVKQLPHFRLLARDGDRLIGQLGLDFRVIRVGPEILHILGIIDLCVRTDMRHRGHGTRLLDEAERTAAGSRADFLVLMADRYDIYLKNGYSNIRPADTKWLGIEDRETVMIIERDLGDCFMAKPIAGNPWPNGQIDMLGYLF